MFFPLNSAAAFAAADVVSRFSDAIVASNADCSVEALTMHCVSFDDEEDDGDDSLPTAFASGLLQEVRCAVRERVETTHPQTSVELHGYWFGITGYGKSVYFLFNQGTLDMDWLCALGKHASVGEMIIGRMMQNLVTR